MSGLALAAFAFLVGITVAGLFGSAMELVTGRRLGFVEPYVSPDKIGLSLLATLAAGPMMLANDALAARGAGRVGVLTLVVATAIAALWACATGVVVAEVAVWLGRPLS